MDSPSFSCSFDGCHKAFKRRDKLDIHVRTHTGERPFVCPFDGCKNSYARSQHLSRHINRIHTSGYKDQLKVKCPHCKQELADTTSLKRHIRVCSYMQDISKPYKCHEEGCTHSFHKKKQLVAHRYQHAEHPGFSSRCWPCQHEGCGKKFSFPNRLKRHMKVHQGYPCDSEGCDKVLPNWSSLRKHKAVEHAPTHSCNTCGMVFKLKSNLTQHIKVHATSREPLTCSRDNCGRIFFYKRNLSQHIKDFHEGLISTKRIRKRHSVTPQKKIKKSKKRSFADRLCGVYNQSEPSHQEESQLEENSSELVSSSIQIAGIHSQAEQPEIQQPTYETGPGAHIYQQIITSSGKLETISVQLTPQQLESLQLELEKKLGEPTAANLQHPEPQMQLSSTRMV